MSEENIGMVSLDISFDSESFLKIKNGLIPSA
jgi:hypothetical protein